MLSKCVDLSCIFISIINICLIDRTSFPVYTMTLCILLLESIEPLEGQKFLKDISDWILNPPIRKDIYVLKGASRKQVLDRMKGLKLTVLPVVSAGLNYEGVVDKDSIMWQITTDFYNYTKKPA
jgi:hypothetical protein